MKLRAQFEEPLPLKWDERMLVLEGQVNVFVNFLNSSIEVVDAFLRVELLPSTEALQRKLLVCTGSHRISRLLSRCIFRFLTFLVRALLELSLYRGG